MSRFVHWVNQDLHPEHMRFLLEAEDFIQRHAVETDKTPEDLWQQAWRNRPDFMKSQTGLTGPNDRGQ